MTNEQAIEILQNLPDAIIAIIEPFDIHYDYKEALRVAIQALKRDGTLSYDDDIESGFSCPVCGAIWRAKE